MKTSIFRRGISGLLAVLMTFTALMGIGTTTAFAASTAGETAESYSVGFPRDGDANLDYSGTWGHDELHYERLDLRRGNLDDHAARHRLLRWTGLLLH